MDKRKLAGFIDHSLLRPDAGESEIIRLCDEAEDYGFHSVCVAPSWIGTAKKRLKTRLLTTVIGFPLGFTFTGVKVREAMQAGLSGADELDIVMNIGRAKSGDWQAVRQDLRDVISATKGLVHKAIIECCYLTREEKIKAVEAAIGAGASFIKTSTGFGPAGATLEDISLIRSVVERGAAPAVLIKAAGGIRTLKETLAFIEAGAARIGTSRGVDILRELPI